MKWLVLDRPPEMRVLPSGFRGVHLRKKYSRGVYLRIALNEKPSDGAAQQDRQYLDIRLFALHLAAFYTLSLFLLLCK